MVQHNKTALVTGASSGIGRATALALDGRSVQEAQSPVESIRSKGGRADAIREAPMPLENVGFAEADFSFLI
jgi:NAD(P)-dependent dehydrogenase (short-subunit alcohol dehydrogenase family)